MATAHGFVIVTGASSGIGAACAMRLDQRGFRVFAGVRRQADSDALRRAASDRLTPLLLDITDAASVVAAAAIVTAAVGEAELCALVNNAGIAVPGPLECLPLADLRRQIEVNVIGQVAVTQAFLPLLRQGRGRIVNMGSTAGRSVLPFAGAYSASKHALRAVNTSLRMELRPWGIAVVLIEPGIIATPIWQRSVADGDGSERDASQERALYGRSLDRAYRLAREQAQAGTPVAAVADAVEHAVTSRRPRARYVVGRNARLRAIVELLPDRARDRIILARVLHGA